MKYRNHTKTGTAKERLELHREMVGELEALRTELVYARKYMGKLPSTAYTGMPKGSPTPGRSRPEEEYLTIESLAGRIEQKEYIIREDWTQWESLSAQIKPMHALIIKLRYHYAGEWSEICKELYGKKPDYETDYERYKNRMFGIHNRAIQELDSLLKNRVKTENR